MKCLPSYFTTLLITTLLFQTPGFAQTQQNTQLTAFSAEYRLEKKGFSIGRINMSLQQKDNIWQYRTHAEPYGITALFSSDEITETASIRLEGDRVVPYQFHAERISKGKTESIQINYDYERKIATLQLDNTQLQIELNTAHYDSQSLQTILMLDLKNNHLKEHYHVIEKDEVKDYQLQIEGEETLATPLGNIKTLKLARNRDNRKTVTWYAIELNYLPVQLADFKKGKQESVMKLLSLN